MSIVSDEVANQNKYEYCILFIICEQTWVLYYYSCGRDDISTSMYMFTKKKIHVYVLLQVWYLKKKKIIWKWIN